LTSPRSNSQAGPYQVIYSSGPGSTHSEFKVKGPGVVIGRKGTLGTVFFSEDAYWPHDTTLWVKDFHGNDPRFAYYFLKTMQLETYDAGASNPTLNRNHIHTLPIHYPSLPLQRKIASVLSAYDDLIENNTRRIEILEEMVQVIYREWFVHFRFPGHEKVQMVDSELGPIPEGWSVKKVSEVASVYRGRSYRSADIVEEGGLPFLNLKCVDRDGGFRREGIRRYQGPYKETQTAITGDIIMAVTDLIRVDSPAQATGGGYASRCGGGEIFLFAAEMRLLTLHNYARKNHGLKPFCVHPALQEAARAHSKDMIKHDYYAHTTKGKNQSACARIHRFGYRWSDCAENIGYNPTPEGVFFSWMRSSIHRRNILDGTFHEIGIGACAGDYSDSKTTMYTVDFGAPAELRPEQSKY
jgi:uncharacterized protein YkwD